MFGFLKPRPAPAAPVRFEDRIVIEKSSELVYGLIDWADPRNALRARGSEICAHEVEPARFSMKMAELPGHLFEIIVTEAVPHASYGFKTYVGPMVGRMTGSHERYVLERLTDDSCRVTLVNSVTFIDNMRLEDFGHEQLSVAAACHNALAKLKIQAEQGVAAVKAVAEKLIV